ncbi:hypothetical protein MAE02_38110 [Microvirga aerophila]|uniref:Uncharacterized protein n=1 Tax=Microvirga aerophila TaxID=670291 RepID=A0A512BW11_9HYPH|nr:hypothetical protein MAE02_38110 [Microvirga aerophila]
MRCSNLTAPTIANRAIEVQQQATDVVLDRDGFLLQELAGGQQRPPLLAGERLDVHRAKEIDPHHLSDAAGIIAVALVDLSFREGFGVARLDAHDWQAGLCQSVEEPLRELARLQPNPLQVPGWILPDPQKILRMGGDLDLTADLPSLGQDAHGGFFDPDFQTRIVLHVAFLPLRLEAATSLYHQPGTLHLMATSQGLRQAEYLI